MPTASEEAPSSDKPLRILWLKSGPLHPLDTGGKKRTYHMLRELKSRHRITYLALVSQGKDSDEARSRAAEYSHEQIWIPWTERRKRSPGFYLEVARNFFLSQLPYSIERYRSDRMAEAVAKMDRAGDFDLVVCDFLTPAVNLSYRGQRPVTPCVLFEHNVESAILKRMVATASNPLLRSYFGAQYRRMARFEREAGSACDAVITVSEEDSATLRQAFGLRNVIGEVPTGVDVTYFAPRTEKPAKPFVAFLGSMDWMPNIDSVDYFVREIYPLIVRVKPDLSMKIVGRNPPARIRALGEADRRIEVTGTVADVRPHIAGAAAIIVPLRVGGGTRIKIFEAMAMGLPVVSTTIGAEGLPVIHGKHILLADSPQTFAESVLQVLDNPELGRSLAGNALGLIRASYTWEKVAERFEQLCLQALSAARGPSGNPAI
jgi:glycosyltransferase involved in cell wall biosynthesis